MQTSPPNAPAALPAKSLWLSDIRPTLVLGLPLAGAQLAQMAINTTDVIMVGWLGPVELGAVVLAQNVYILFWMFGMGVCQAIVPLAAAARGRKDARAMRRSVRMGLWIVACYCGPVWLLLWFSEDILLVLGQEPQISAAAGAYVRVMQWSLFPALAVMALRCFLTVTGLTQVVLWVTVLSAFLNGGLNYLLIFGNFGFPRLELVGAAIASVLTSSFGFLLLAVYVTRHRRLRRFAIFGRIWRPDWPDFFTIIKVGTPIGATIVAEGLLFSGSTLMMGWLGTVSLAAHGIALQLAAITFMIPLGISQAGMSRIGIAAGQRDRSAVARAGWVTLGLALVSMGCAAITFWTIPEFLVGLFLDSGHPDTPPVLALAAVFLGVAAIFQLADGAQVAAGSILRGLGDTMVPFLLALAGYIAVGMTTAYVLAFVIGLGGVGIWWGLAVGLAFTAVLAIWRFSQRERLGLVSRG
ncbi:MATE family efflux transporter [Pannonibacter phragmitetus]|uniref:MATE family efflux transporter n=1 Tax=Pannonibacter phragmitetus TaxID=121719 RepID=UPI000F0235AA|nr:MATE family efflux transporter [Pannonibacter phragmitetus]